MVGAEDSASGKEATWGLMGRVALLLTSHLVPLQ